jgi:hypothetical protein
MIDNIKIYSLTKYINETNNLNKDVFIIFNEWSRKNNLYITDFEDAMWFIDYIKHLLKIDKAIIEEAQIFDKKEMERTGVFNGKNKKIF